ncbi:MAG: glycerophosphodiester phosphodiesterase family protein [Bacteroidota bacterium]
MLQWKPKILSISTRTILFVAFLAIYLSSCSNETLPEKPLIPAHPINRLAEAQLLVNHPIEVVVHRGANHLAPENTYAASARAIELGVDYVEIDVHRSWDGVHYLMHDMTLGRTTDGWGFIFLRTSTYMDGLDAGSWFSKQYAGEPIPRLDQYLQWIKGKAKVYLDVKTGDLAEIVALIRELGMEEEVFFWFWNTQKARKLKELAPAIGLKINAATPAEVRKAKAQHQATIIECEVGQLTAELGQTCRELGIRLMVYAQHNTREEYEAIIRSPADLVNLDRPELYLQVLDSLHRHKVTE